MLLYSLKFDAYCDSGTGFTSAAQTRWLGAAQQRVLGTLHDTQRAECVGDETTLVIETMLSEEEVRGCIVKALGDRAAYVSVRSLRPDELPPLVHPNQRRSFRGVLLEAQEEEFARYGSPTPSNR